MAYKQYDVVIVGAGISGCSLAALLAKNTSLSIALLDAKTPQVDWQDDAISARVSAINHGATALFKQLGVWDDIITRRAAAYTHMSVFDEQTVGQVEFDCAEVGSRYLGHIIENDLILQVLQQHLQQTQVDCLWPVTLNKYELEGDKVLLSSAEGDIYQTPLVLAADGAKSWVRQAANFSLQQAPYQQTAIVTTVQTTEPHQFTARQCFLSSGPLAFLPLQNHYQHSIVWSCEIEKANRLLMMSDHEFAHALQQSFDFGLGEVTQVNKRYAFPLLMRHVDNYMQPHCALLGDAAHTIHPLAGQGLNISLQDVQCLAELIAKAVSKQQCYYSERLLKKYARTRKAENTITVKAMGGFKKLFANQDAAVLVARSQGLRLVNRFSFIKNVFIKHAMGL